MGKFTEDTAVLQIGEDRWRGELCKGWRIGSVPNGGYILAVIGRALRAALPHQDPLSINAFYLSPCTLGEVEITVEPLRANRGTSFATATLWQNGEMKVRATAAYTDLHRVNGQTWLGNAPPEAPPFADTTANEARMLEIHDSVDTRLVRGYEVFDRGDIPGTGEFVAWLEHRDRAEIDTLDMLMFADIMPPPVFTLFGPYGWVPTIELTVQVRNKPAPGPILGRLRSWHLTDGITESDGDFWDSEGQLIALARQTMKVKVPEEGSNLGREA